MKPFTKADFITDLSRHLAERLEFDLQDEEAAAGLQKISEAVFSYFAMHADRGTHPSSAAILQYVLFSALWEGVAPQETIDQFFSFVDVDPSRLLAAWRRLDPTERKSMMTVALIPGRLDEAEICDVVSALYKNRKDMPV